MASLSAIMAALETVVGTIPGLRVSDTSPGQVTPPMAIIGVPPVTSYQATMGRARYTLEPTITVLVSAAADRAGQLALAGYADPVGASSIPAAIWADRTLGGIVEDCIVDSFRPLGLEEIGTIGYFGGTFSLRVIARGA